MERILNRQNIDSEIREYDQSIQDIGGTLSGLRGYSLFNCLKRTPVGSGPYSHVTMFEAANRIMTDLVILRGVKWLLDESAFPFDEYIVEYGNEDNNDHDITASKGDQHLSGEAFNVAPSFFQIKKSSMLRKLRGQENMPAFNIIVANSDAIEDNYSPRVREGEYYIFVDVETGNGNSIPNIQDDK
jgi:hypothetical protein